MPKLISASAAAAVGERICAPGRPPKTRAHAARYAASQPFAHARATASGAATGARTAQTSASPSIGATASVAAAFAGTVRSGTWWNWNHEIGAVASPHAAEIATAPRSQPGSGYPSSHSAKRGATRKIASTAANDSWKPGSRALYGLHASRTIAVTSRAWRASRCRPVSQASDPSAPAIPARSTDGCGPTAST